MIRYCKYLQENDAKRARYIKRFKEEQKAKEAKDIEIAKLEKKLEEVSKNSAKLEQKVSSLRKYEDYLEMVVKKSDRFPNLEALYRHYTSLEHSLNKLTDLSTSMQKNLEHKRNYYSQLEKDKGNEIVLLNNDITVLQKKLEVNIRVDAKVFERVCVFRTLRLEGKSYKQQSSNLLTKRRKRI